MAAEEDGSRSKVALPEFTIVSPGIAQGTRSGDEVKKVAFAYDLSGVCPLSEEIVIDPSQLHGGRMAGVIRVEALNRDIEIE
jgi:hypothetical protein